MSLKEQKFLMRSSLVFYVIFSGSLFVCNYLHDLIVKKTAPNSNVDKAFSLDDEEFLIDGKIFLKVNKVVSLSWGRNLHNL